MVGPNNLEFSYYKASFWGVLGVPPSKETPVYIYIAYICIYIYLNEITWYTLVFQIPAAVWSFGVGLLGPITSSRGVWTLI